MTKQMKDLKQKESQHLLNRDVFDERLPFKKHSIKNPMVRPLYMSNINLIKPKLATLIIPFETMVSPKRLNVYEQAPLLGGMLPP